jgi:hypothetical protein
MPRLAPSTPGEGEERRTCSGVDGLLVLNPAASPSLAGGGGVQQAGVVPGCASTLREGRSTHYGR